MLLYQGKFDGALGCIEGLVLWAVGEVNVYRLYQYQIPRLRSG